MAQLHYRPEIDGLRALAVWSVVFFHAGLSGFEGGYLGVDVFFVISGYLISSIIFSELELRTFTLSGFYERRIRRLLPPLLVMLLVMTPIITFYAPPDTVRLFGHAMSSTLVFISNVFFYNSAGYWEMAAEENPLIHTWSLSVEEQFYAVFPLIASMLFVGKKRVFLILLALGFLGSLILSQAAQQYCCWVQSFNFYMIFSRAWELCLGIFAALILRQPAWAQQLSVGSISSVLQAFGLLALCLAIFLFDNTTPHPSLFTLLPTLGTFCLIIGLNANHGLGVVLSYRPIVYLGLTSYSLYLWHQPIFALWRLTSIEVMNYKSIIICVLLSILLAHISWRYIEKYFRNRTHFSRRQIFGLAAIVSLFLFVPGLVLGQKEGIYTQLYERSLSSQQKILFQALRQAEAVSFDAQMRPPRDCRYHTREINSAFTNAFEQCAQNGQKINILIGDSQGMNLFNILTEVEKGGALFSVSREGCNFSRDVSCEIKGLESFLRDNAKHIQRVIYHQAGSYLLRDVKGDIDGDKLFIVPGGKIDAGGMERTVDILDELAKYVPVLWVGPFLEPRLDLVKHIHLDAPLVVNAISQSIFATIDDEIRAYLADMPKIQYAGFTDIFDYDESSIYQAPCLLYRDGSHFSVCGERFVARTYRGGIF